MLPSPPRWAWVLATLLAAAAIAVFLTGRGGTAVLTAVALGFASLAVLLLTTGDALPDADDTDEGT